MQVSKAYSGTIDVGTSSARQLSYGITTTAAYYQNKIDIFNQMAASFLRDECGVEAAYETRSGSSAKFLWIYDVPFLFGASGVSNNFFNFYGPYYAGALITGTATTTNIFSAATSGDYKFSLILTGNPKSAFALRLIRNGASAPVAAVDIRFMKATNVINGKNAVVWCYGDAAGTNATGIDLNEDGTMDADSFTYAAFAFYQVMQTKAVNKAVNPTKFPLSPLMIGPYKIQDVYQHPMGWSVPASLTATSVNQTEFSISGRRFISTTSDTPAAGRINIGLIEVTD